MTRTTVDDDLTLAFILGRGGARLSFAGSSALTFVACLGIAASAAAGVFSHDVAFAAFVLVPIVVSWFSAPASSCVVAIVAFLFANGFAFDSVGTLSWHGETDVVRLIGLTAIALTASVLGSGSRVRAQDKAEHADGHPRVAA